MPVIAFGPNFSRTTNSRLHSVCDYKSPIDYERESWASLTVEPAA